MGDADRDPFMLHIDDVLAKNSITEAIKGETGLQPVFVVSNPSDTAEQRALLAAAAARDIFLSQELSGLIGKAIQRSSTEEDK